MTEMGIEVNYLVSDEPFLCLYDHMCLILFLLKDLIITHFQISITVRSHQTRCVCKNASDASNSMHVHFE